MNNNYRDKIRTSSTSQLIWTNPIIYNLTIKISQKLGIPTERGEHLQGQKYLPGQFFKPHTDAFSPKIKNKAKASGNRVHTLMIYLNDDMEGEQHVSQNLIKL